MTRERRGVGGSREVWGEQGGRSWREPGREDKGKRTQKGEAGREERVRRLRTFKMCMFYNKLQVYVPTQVL